MSNSIVENDSIVKKFRDSLPVADNIITSLAIDESIFADQAGVRPSTG